MMVPVGRLTLVRTFAKSELIRAMSFVAIPSLIGPMRARSPAGLIVAYLHWRAIFFVNLPIGIAGLILVYSAPAGLSGEGHPSTRYPRPDPVRLGRRTALLRSGDIRGAYAQHRRNHRAAGISFVLLFGYGLHATAPRSPARHDAIQDPHVRRRGRRQLLYRLGIGGVPFLLPLLYQVGLGFTPVQSGC